MGCCFSRNKVGPEGGNPSSDRLSLLSRLGITHASHPLLHGIVGVDEEQTKVPDELSVESIIEHPLLRQLFMIFISSRLAEENGRFLLDMRELNSNSMSMSEEQVRTAIEFIVNEYVRRSSPMSVNLPDKMRKDVVKKTDDRSSIEAGEALHILGSADNEIRRLVRLNFLDGFQQWLNGEESGSSCRPAPLQRSLDGRKRVVIIGGGFCGAFAARDLDAHPGLRVTMVDTKSFIEYTPSVLKVFCRPELHSKIVIPHEAVVKNGDVVVGAVRAVRDRELVVNRETIPFDFAIVATGSHYPSSIKSVAISSKFRGKQVAQQRRMMEQARRICVVGGGFVGCELACEIKDSMSGIKVSLVHSRPRVMQRLVHSGAGDPHALAMERFAELGIETHLEQRATSWDKRARQVITSTGARIDADHVFWCGGPEPMTKFMVPHFSHTLDSRGYVQVDENHRIVGATGMFAGGDCSVFRLGDNDRQARQRLRSLDAVDAVELHGAFLERMQAGAISGSEGGGAAAGGGSSEEDSSGGSSESKKEGEPDSPEGPPLPAGQPTAEVPSMKPAKDVRKSHSMSSIAIPSDSGCVHEEKMAKNAVEHGIIIADNIRRLLEGKSLKARKPELGVNMMIVSMGLKKGIYVENGVAQAGDFVPKKDWLEETVVAELAEGKHILH